LTLKPKVSTLDELSIAKARRNSGYAERTADAVIADMEQLVAEAEVKYGAK